MDAVKVIIISICKMQITSLLIGFGTFADALECWNCLSLLTQFTNPHISFVFIDNGRRPDKTYSVHPRIWNSILWKGNRIIHIVGEITFWCPLGKQVDTYGSHLSSVRLLVTHLLANLFLRTLVFIYIFMRLEVTMVKNAFKRTTTQLSNHHHNDNI